MAINPLNLQMSVPRIPDASNIQQQALQKPVVDQTNLAQEALKHTENTRTQTQKTNETEKGKIKDENDSQQSHEQKKKKKHQQQASVEDNKSKHPYKGHSIDIKL